MYAHPLPRHSRRLTYGFLFLYLLWAPAPVAGEPGRDASVYVEVSQPGLVRVPAEDLRAWGLHTGALGAWRQGLEVASLPHRAGEDFTFLALDVAGAHTSKATYVLAPRAASIPGPSVLRLRPLPIPADTTTRVHARRTIDARDLSLGALAAARAPLYAQNSPHWFISAISPGGTAWFDLNTDPAVSAGPQSVVLHVARTHEGSVQLEAGWGDGSGLPMAPAPAPGDLLGFSVELPERSHDSRPPRIKVVDRSPAPPPAPPRDVSEDRGVVWVDALFLEGLVQARVPGHGVLEVQAQAALGVSPASPAKQGVALWLAPDGKLERAALLEGAPREGEGWLLPASGPGARLLLCARPSVARPSAAVASSDLLARAKGAQHVILATPALLSGAQRLAEHRTRTGVPSVALDVRLVYQAYGFGEAVPAAIRRFVQALEARPGVGLEFLLLAGDATYDRTDLVSEPTIPAPMTRSAWNGATPSDRLYVEPSGGGPGGAHVGRLPFDQADEMDAYVTRLIRYETQPPADERRRMLRFITNEARFGVMVDRWIEAQFRNILVEDLPPAYDVEVTFGSPASPYYWPPAEMNAKVVGDLNTGSLFTVYVGHGYTQGFDAVRIGNRQHRVLDVRDAPRVKSVDLPSVLCVLACSTAGFDLPGEPGIGETLLRQPQGPLAFWGATRICHPSWNTLVGKEIAGELGRARPPQRLGPLLDGARDRVLRGEGDVGLRRMIAMGTPLLAPGPRLDDVLAEGARMYEILGDPALLLALPEPTLEVEAQWLESGPLAIRVRGPLPEGTPVRLRLEHLRDWEAPLPPLPKDSGSTAYDAAVRARHGAANDRVLAEGMVTVQGGVGEVTLDVVPDPSERALVVKAFASGKVGSGASAWMGATVVPTPTR